MDLTAHIDATAACLRAAARDGYLVEDLARAAVKVANRRDTPKLSAALYAEKG